MRAFSISKDSGGNTLSTEGAGSKQSGRSGRTSRWIVFILNCLSGFMMAPAALLLYGDCFLPGFHSEVSRCERIEVDMPDFMRPKFTGRSLGLRIVVGAHCSIWYASWTDRTHEIPLFLESIDVREVSGLRLRSMFFDGMTELWKVRYCHFQPLTSPPIRWSGSEEGCPDVSWFPTHHSAPASPLLNSLLETTK